MWWLVLLVSFIFLSILLMCFGGVFVVSWMIFRCCWVVMFVLKLKLFMCMLMCVVGFFRVENGVLLMR